MCESDRRSLAPCYLADALYQADSVSCDPAKAKEGGAPTRALRILPELGTKAITASGRAESLSGRCPDRRNP